MTDLTAYAERVGIYAKKWTTHKGKIAGGNPITKMSMHRILRDRVYIGQIETKATHTVADGEHDAILSEELFNRVQEILECNANHKSSTRRSPNLLSGKLYYHTVACFINQQTCGKAKADKYYYATKGFYIPAPPVDEIAMKAVADFLDSDMSALPVQVANNLKQICFDNLAYVRRKELARTLIQKVTYSQNKLIVYIDTTADVKDFTSDTFNQNANQMDFVLDGEFVIINIPIMLSRYISKIKPGTLTLTDNNHLILKAFATAWRYREMYERCGDVPKWLVLHRVQFTDSWTSHT